MTAPPQDDDAPSATDTPPASAHDSAQGDAPAALPEPDHALSEDAALELRIAPISDDTNGPELGSYERFLLDLQGFRGHVRLFTTALVILSLVLLTVIVSSLESVLKPLLVSVFLCYLILPGVSFLVRNKVPKTLAYVLSLGTITAVLYGFGQLVALNIREVITRWPFYKQALSTYLNDANAIALRYKLLPADEQISLQNALSLFSGESITNFIGGGTSVFLSIVETLVTVLIFMLFILYEAERLPRRIRLAFKPQTAKRVLAVFANINSNVQNYIMLKALVSFITAVVSAVILGFVDLDFLYLIALLIFALNFIPYLGSVLATIAPTVVALVQFQSPSKAFWLGFILSLVQLLIGNVIEPRLQGHQLNLSPLVILTALAFWAWMWGLGGMLLAIPITVSMYIVLKQFQATRPIAIMMSGLERGDEQLPLRTLERIERIEPDESAPA